MQYIHIEVSNNHGKSVLGTRISAHVMVPSMDLTKTVPSMNSYFLLWKLANNNNNYLI